MKDKIFLSILAILFLGGLAVVVLWLSDRQREEQIIVDDDTSDRNGETEEIPTQVLNALQPQENNEKSEQNKTYDPNDGNAVIDALKSQQENVPLTAPEEVLQNL